MSTEMEQITGLPIDHLRDTPRVGTAEAHNEAPLNIPSRTPSLCYTG